MEVMEDLASPAPLTWQQRLLAPRTLAALAAGLLMGGALTAGIWYFQTKPQLDAAQLVYDATMDLWSLYDLQMASMKTSGTYRSGLDALLKTAPDGAALKARLASHVDLNTIAVVGDAEKFKIELNILNKDRTLLKVKGPIGKYMWTAQAARVIPEHVAGTDDGAPIAR